MIYAYSNPDITKGSAIKAVKKSVGYCPDCGSKLIPKCGMIKIDHWAHTPNSDCHQYEPMSEWHLRWQLSMRNPVGGVNIEVPVVIGEKYKRADLVTHDGIIIEFQHSPMSLEERLERESHYKTEKNSGILWVIHPSIKSSKTWDKETNSKIFVDIGDVLYDLHVSTNNERRSFSFGYEKKNSAIFSKDFINAIINGRNVTSKTWEKLHNKYDTQSHKKKDPYLNETLLHHDNSVRTAVNWKSIADEKAKQKIIEESAYKLYQKVVYPSIIPDDFDRNDNTRNSGNNKITNECTNPDCRYVENKICTSPATCTDRCIDWNKFDKYRFQRDIEDGREVCNIDGCMWVRKGVCHAPHGYGVICIKSNKCIDEEATS
jgi:competence CoiA-like predicted nuclease